MIFPIKDFRLFFFAFRLCLKYLHQNNNSLLLKNNIYFFRFQTLMFANEIRLKIAIFLFIENHDTREKDGRDTELALTVAP